MSIYMNSHAPVNRIRGLFFLMSFILIFFFFPPIHVYANESETATFTKKIYHRHTGSFESGGGCYTVAKQSTKTEQVPCEGTMVYWPELNSTSCSKCGASYSGDQSYRRCWYEETRTTKYTYYDLGCNQTDKTVLGTLSVFPDTTEWTRQVVLTGSFEVKGKMKVRAKPYIWNGNAATAENTFPVVENGEYSLKLNADDNANTNAAKVKISVTNIDNTAPVIQSYKMEPEAEWTKEKVLLSVTAVQDLQPDGNEGVGLHEKPYSFDGGNTWTAENTYYFTENGTCTVMVRDALENISSMEIQCRSIDVTAPRIQKTEYDTTANIRCVIIDVTAQDLQPDGSEGAGLHETAYSYDGGESWTEENTWLVNQNRTVKIAVRDKLGNTAYGEVEINNIDDKGPEISYKLEPDTWTNGSVFLTVSAQDFNNDKSPGVGLAEEWLSLDDGITWSANNRLEYSENRTVTVRARDKNDNIAVRKIKIATIDKIPPRISFSKKLIKDKDMVKVKISIQAQDMESGLHDTPFSWNGGKKYVCADTKMVERNGKYKVSVRDKAGNVGVGSLVIADIPIPEEGTQEEEESSSESKTKPPKEEPETVLEEPKEEPVVPRDKPEEESTLEEPVTEREEEQETITVIKKEEKRVDRPKEQLIRNSKHEDKGWDRVVLFLIMLLLLLLLLLLLFIWERTIAVYVEAANGKLKYMGRRWIHDKEGRYEVYIKEAFMEKCPTTHFLFRPARLFAALHKGDDLCFLFPEKVCIIRRMRCDLDISLL